MKYILYKGFIGIDGISLTVGEVTPTRFCVHLIPKRWSVRRLARKAGRKGQYRNRSQTQAVVDTVERVLAARESAISNITGEAGSLSLRVKALVDTGR